MAGVSLTRDTERPLCKTAKMNCGLPWRPQDVGDARASGFLLRRTISPRERRMLQSTKLKGVRDEECFDIRHGVSGFEVCPAGFGTSLVQYFLTYRTAVLTRALDNKRWSRGYELERKKSKYHYLQKI